MRHPSKIVNVGDMVDVLVLDVNKATKRISLGMKQVEADPWATIDERYKPGERVQGKVRNLTDFGAFVELEPGVEGLIHISELARNKVWRVKDIFGRRTRILTLTAHTSSTT